ncbi:MAG: YlxR family protein [Dehalococcoidia bacterium]
MGQQKGRIQTRTCVVCRERRHRDALLRIVKTPDGQVVFDRTGHMDGRGAYVCGDASHWGAKLRGNGIDTGKLKHALKTEIDDSMVKMLGDAINSQLTEQLLRKGK